MKSLEDKITNKIADLALTAHAEAKSFEFVKDGEPKVLKTDEKAYLSARSRKRAYTIALQAIRTICEEHYTTPYSDSVNEG